MPFTPAHAAAALPFRRFRVVTSALVVGTLAPDFEYFLRLAPDRGFGHSLQGCFVLTLPLALLVLWIFHRFVKFPLVALLPEPIQKRLGACLGEFRFGGGTRFLLIVMSALLGIATHILWDAFTHPNTWPYGHFAWLRESLPLPVLGSVPTFKILQHTSTILGLGILAGWFWKWFKRTKPSDRPLENPLSRQQRIRTICFVVCLGTAGAGLRALWSIGIPIGAVAFKRFVGELVVTAIALAWWQLVVYGVVTNATRAKSQPIP